MEILIIIGIFLIVIVIYYSIVKRNKQPLYFKIQKKLEEELLQANFNNEWKKIQDINSKLLWLKILNEVNTVDFLKETEYDIAKKFTLDELKFPTNFELNNIYHFPFAQVIISEYGKILEKNEYSDCLYKPDKILTHPKELVKKAIAFAFEYLENPKVPIESKKEFVEALKVTSLS